MARNTARSKLAAQADPPRKKRNFFSKPGINLPVLRLAQAPSPQRQVSSDRILAALQPDKAVVVAAKTFVKEKMGDDKYDQSPSTSESSRVTRGAEAEANQVKMRGRPARKVPTAKTTPKQYAVGSDVVTIGQRIKATTKAAATGIKSTATGITRKITLRSKQAESAASDSAASTPPSTSESTSAALSDAAAEPEPMVVDTPNSTPATQPEAEAKVDAVSKPEAPVAGPSAPRAAASTRNPNKDKVYMNAGFFCQEEDAEHERVLINRILAERGEPLKRISRPRRSGSSAAPLAPLPTVDGVISFPPLPLDMGYTQFFEQENEFSLPYNIIWECQNGSLDGKRRPPFFRKISTNQFNERPKRLADEQELETAHCRCDTVSGCGDNCINRIMGYICGPDCPCGDACNNKSMWSRKAKGTKVVFTGSRGFGLVATEDIKDGDFVIDYRGEVIEIETFMDRTEEEYKGKKDYYAMAYGPGEVIDAGLCGSDARFINHGCEPNLEVRKFISIGDGFEEYELGLFAIRDIKAGEELFYDYNFEAFGDAVIATRDGSNVKCQCGAATCRGFLGRKASDVALPEKKKPGPKRKAPADAPLGPDGLPIKRPRGRPRKHPLPDANNPVIKRPRGRPRIHPLPDPNAPKRPRGRPRKHPLPDPNAGPKRRGRPPKVRPENEPAPSKGKRVVSAVTEIARRVTGRERPRKTYREPSVTEDESDDWSAADSDSPSLASESTSPEPDTKPVVPKSKESSPVAEGSARGGGASRLSKQAQKAKRNGAPAGWVYVVDPVTANAEASGSGTARAGSEVSERTASGRAARLAARRG